MLASLVRRGGRAAIVVVAGTTVLGGAALAGGDTTLRDRTGVTLGDAAFDREDVGVVWREPLGGAPAVYVRTSEAAGTVFAPSELVIDNARQPSVELCANRVFVAYARDYGDGVPGRWAIDLRTRAVSATGFTGAAVSSGQYLARDPDVACASGRLFAAWVEQRPGGARTLVSDSLRASLSFDMPIDLGAASEDRSPPVVAGVGRWAYVAWRVGNDIKVKRFGVGPGPAFALTAYGDTIVGDGTLARPVTYPVIAAYGPRVVVAWTRCGHTQARVSTDHGATWGPVRTLVRGACGSEAGAFPTGAAIHGDRIAVTVVTTFGATASRVVRTRNGFASFTDTLLSDPVDLELFGYVTFPEAIGWASVRDRGSRLTYRPLGNTAP